MAERESDIFKNVNFDASLHFVMQFCHCQLDIRYHVTRAEAETCYGRFESWNKNKIRKVCLLRRSGIIQDRHCLIYHSIVPESNQSQGLPHFEGL